MKGTAYLIQATLISLWWIGLLVDQNFYDTFQFPGIGKKAFNALMLPDLLVVALLSVVRAYKQWRNLDHVILGGFAFATLYCINATILTGGGFLATTVMILGLCYNLFLVHSEKLFRNSSTSNVFINALKTLFQIVCVWMITLFVFPVLIMNAFGIEPSATISMKVSAIALFIVFSLLGLYSAIVMVRIGEGTPLPLDQTQKLVTKGPYKYVRNPMAIAGIGQGIAIAIFFGSIHLLSYVILGAILWHFVVRPIEEKDMIQRFGDDYVEYRNRVRCWIPKF